MKLLKSIWMLQREKKILAVELTSSLSVVKDSHKGACIQNYPCLYKRICTRHSKNLVNHQDDLLECLINIYRALQYHWLQHAAGVD